MKKVGLIALLAGILLEILSFSEAFSKDTFTAFGTKDYIRTTGKPTTAMEDFSVLNPNTSYTLHIYNGGKNNQFKGKVSSAVISLNGAEVVRPNEFNQNVTHIEKPIKLSKDNALAVELRSKPDSGLTIEIIGLDNDPPTIVATSAPLPNAARWNKTDVTVSFACSDATSGIAFCPGPVLVQQEGADQVITGTATDIAGNTASASVTINLDKTSPTIGASLTPSPNASGWNNTNTTVHFTCSDTTSGIASCPGDITAQQDGANQVITGTATDIAGNTASTSVTINLDKTLPTISATLDPPPNAAGWNNTNTTVHFTCSDVTSGITSCPGDVLVPQDGANQVITGTATDVAENTASTSVAVNIDKTPPVITIISPLAGANNLDSPALVQGTIEALSGVATMTCNGAPATLSGSSFTCNVSLVMGQNLIQTIATDQAGNTGQASITVEYLGPRYLAIVDVMVFDQEDFSPVPADYTGLAWSETCTNPYVPNVTGSWVMSNNVNWGIGGSITTVWVKYDFVPRGSSTPVLVNYGNFHWPYWNVDCPAGWQPANGTSRGIQGALTTGTWSRCNRNGLCVQYLPMNQTDTFVTNVGLAQFGLTPSYDCPVICEANGGYWPVMRDTYDIHAGCRDDVFVYFCSAKGMAAPRMPTSIDVTEQEKLNFLATYAPRVWLAAGEENPNYPEPYFPSPVGWAFSYLERFKNGDYYWLRTKESLGSPSDTLDFFRGCHGYYSAFPPCSLSDAPVYAFWVKKSDQVGEILFDYVDLVYFFYYPYNRGKEIKLVSTVFGNHVSDWEHVTVRLGWGYDEQTGWSLQPTQVYLPAHDFGAPYFWDEIPKTNDTHPVVYAAWGSHGVWLTAGAHKYGEVWIGPFEEDLIDYTSEGTAWDTWNNVEAFDYNLQQGLEGNDWPLWMSADFADPGVCGYPSYPDCGPIYRWGNPESGCMYGQCRLENGPTGPVSKDVWSSGIIK